MNSLKHILIKKYCVVQEVCWAYDLPSVEFTRLEKQVREISPKMN